MENNLEKKELEQNAKKEWVSPEMQELNLNTGPYISLAESIYATPSF